MDQTQRPHLVAVVAAAAVLFGLLVLGSAHARGVEAERVHALAADEGEQKLLGSALQREALRHSDLLVVYGSSELLRQRPYQAPFEAVSVFADRPSGFSVFRIAKPHNACLTILQSLAGLGGELRGRKLVISLSPPWFFMRARPHAEGYAGNFSPLHASELAFSSELSLELRRAVARRMLEYPDTLDGQPLLRFALERLAADGWLDAALYRAVWPLGKLGTALQRAQDHWQTLLAVRRHRAEPHRTPPRAVDWPRLMTRARQVHAENSLGNPYGIDASEWRETVSVLDTRDPADGARYRGYARDNVQWLDLELLLRGAEELGADVLLISAPVHGVFFEAQGLTRADRELYYERVRTLARAHHARAVLFADHDADTEFSIDPFGHPSPVGWLYFDRALEAFYKGEALGEDGAL